MKHLHFSWAHQKGGSKIPLRNFANRSNSCVARSVCDNWATCLIRQRIRALQRLYRVLVPQPDFAKAACPQFDPNMPKYGARRGRMTACIIEWDMKEKDRRLWWRTEEVRGGLEKGGSRELCKEKGKCAVRVPLKCHSTQGNAVSPPPIYGERLSPTSDFHRPKTDGNRKGNACWYPNIS